MAIKLDKLQQLDKWFREARRDMAAERFRELGSFSPSVPVCEVGGGGSLALQFMDGVPYLSVLDARGKVEAVIGDDMGCDEQSVRDFFGKSQLPKVSGPRREYLLDEAKRNWESVKWSLNSVMYEEMRERMMASGFDRADDVLVSLMVDAIVLDEPDRCQDQDFYHLAFCMGGPDSPRVGAVQEHVLSNLNRIHKSLYEKGLMESGELKELLAYNVRDVGGRFSMDSYLKGRLDKRYDNLTTLDGEYSVSCIAEQAVWAQKNPDFAPFLGARLEGWVKGKADECGFDLKDVNAERVRLGGSVTAKKARPKLTEAQKKSFDRGLR